MGKSMDSTQCNRLWLCCLSICLLWVTTLKAAVELARTYIAVPAFEGITSICKDGYQMTNYEKDKYTKCTTDQIASCNSKFDEYLKSESIRITELQVINNNTLSKHGNLSATTDQVVQEYKSRLEASSIIYNTNCSATQLNTLKSYLSESTQVYHSAREYVHDTDGLVVSMKQYVIELNNYNKDYYNNQSVESRKLFSSIANSSLDEGYSALNVSMTTLLSNMLTDIDNCFGLSNETMGNSCSSSARSAYEEIKQETNTQMIRMQFYNYEVESTFDTFVTTVTDTLDVVEAFYDAVNEVIDNVDNTLCTGDSSWCDFSPIDWQISIPQLPDFPTPHFIPSAVNVWGEGYNDALNDAKVNISSTFQTVQDMIDSMKASINSELNIAHFDAYQPPSYEGGNMSLVVDNHLLSSNAYINSLTTNNTEYEASSSSSDNKWTVSDINESSYSTNWMSGHVNLLKIKQIIVYIISLFDNLYIFDYLYRIVHSLHLVKKYWSNSLVSLPMINISNTKGKYQFQDNYYVLAAYKVLCIFPYLYVQAFIAITLVLLVLVSIVNTYIPIYNSFIEGCTQQSTDTTYLSDQLLSIAYNYASYHGNVYTKSNIERYNSDATAICSSRSASDQHSHDTFINQLTQFNESIIKNDYYFALMTACVSSSQPSPSDVSYMHNISAIPTIESLRQSNDATYAVYNCGSQPTCTVTCDMNKEVLQSVTDTCSCNLQWYFHSNIMLLVAVLLAFFCLNASRILLLKGIIMLYWRRFAPEMFTYKASCDIKGKFITPNVAVSPPTPPSNTADYAFMMENPFYVNSKNIVKQDDVEKVVGVELDKQMTRYQCKALLCIVGSFFMLMALLIPLHYAGAEINYEA